jgi:hypothetical protein
MVKTWMDGPMKPLIFFKKAFFQNLSFQTRGAAYLLVRLIHECLQYVSEVYT